MPRARPIRVHLSRVNKAGGTYYRLRWTVPGEGRETIESLGYVTPTEADEARRRKEAELLLGVASPSSSPSVSVKAVDVLVAYGEGLVDRYGADSPYVANVVRRTAPLVRHLGALRVDAIRERHLEDYAHARHGEKGGRHGSQRPRRSVIIDEVKLMRRALAWHSARAPLPLQVPPMPALKGLRPDARPKRRLTLEELGKVIAALHDRGAADGARLVEFLAWCPRRPVAVLGLVREDCRRVLDSADACRDGDVWIANDKGAIGLGWAPLLPRARAVLREHLHARIGPVDAPVWTRPDGRRWTNQALRGLLVRACARAGVEYVQPYDLRRFGVTRALRACHGDPEAAKEFSGHLSAQTVLRYAYADRDVVRAAAAGESE